jgi:hypothetical protein
MYVHKNHSIFYSIPEALFPAILLLTAAETPPSKDCILKIPWKILNDLQYRGCPKL